MKCEMECTKRAKVKISLSGSGDSMCLCYKHGFMYVKIHMQRLGERDFGIYIQRPPDKVHKPIKREEPQREEVVEESEDKSWDF